MATVFEELCSVFKTKPKSTEGQVLFGKRIAKLIDKLEDPEYAELSKATQVWAKAFMEGMDERLDQEEMPAIAGWPAHDEEEADDGESSEEDAADHDDDGDEDDNEEARVAKKSKAKKKAPAKKAVAKKAKKAVSAKSKGNGTAGAGRKGAFDQDAKIKVLAKENPRREGSKKFDLFKKYKTGMTVKEALAAGIPWGMIRKDASKKNISIS